MQQKKQTAQHAPGKTDQYWHWIALAIIMVLAAAIRVQLLGVPLERDEGEYAYAGQLILQGIPPYAQVYNMKMPGIYATYALMMSVLGQTQIGIHLGLLIVNSATTLLLFLLGRSLFNRFAGLITAAVFAFLSMGQPVQGIFANAEHFVILPAIGGILLLNAAIVSNRNMTLVAGALLLGLAFIMKQHGAAFIAFGGLFLFFKELRRKPFNGKSLLTRCLIYLGGATLPFALTCLVLLQAGVFDKFWFWTFDYASEYVSSTSFSAGLDSLKSRAETIAGSSVFVWVLVAIGLSSLAWSKKSREHILFILLFSLFSFLAVCPGFYFRPHYFILLLPAAALLAGIGAGSLYELINSGKVSTAKKMMPLLLVFYAIGYGVWQQREFLFFMTPHEASRSSYGLNPFPESLEIARFLENNTDETDQIAILGSEPQIYFYAKRHSASGHIYTYALMETHPYALPMQEEMIKEIEAARPAFLVLVDIPTSWLFKKNSNQLIFDWFGTYSREHYQLTGVVDIDNKKTTYVWNEDVPAYQAKSPYTVSIFRRVD